MNIVGVYKEIQDQHMNIVCAYVLNLFLIHMYLPSADHLFHFEMPRPKHALF